MTRDAFQAARSVIPFQFLCLWNNQPTHILKQQWAPNFVMNTPWQIPDFSDLFAAFSFFKHKCSRSRQRAESQYRKREAPSVHSDVKRFSGLRVLLYEPGFVCIIIIEFVNRRVFLRILSGEIANLAKYTEVSPVKNCKCMRELCMGASNLRRFCLIINVYL